MPAKPTMKSATCSNSGKFIAWVSFILATFAMAGVIVEMANKTTDGGSVSSPVKGQPKSITQSETDKSTIEDLTKQIGDLSKGQERLALNLSLMQDYLAKATKGNAGLEWSDYQLEGLGYTVHFIFPSLPSSVEGGQGYIEFGYDNAEYFKDFDVLISEGGPGYECTMTNIQGTDYCESYDSSTGSDGRTYNFQVKDVYNKPGIVSLHFTRCGPNDCIEQKSFDAAIAKVLKSYYIERAPLLP